MAPNSISQTSLPRRLLSSPWLNPLNDLDALDDLIQPLGLIWSPSRIRARVLRVRQETPDTRSFVLQPNGRWPGHRAGQHVAVYHEVNGRRLQRHYSLSSTPDEELPTITVKRQPDGVISNSLHDRLQPGMRLELGAPEGDFTVPEPTPERLFLIAGGSGITPLWSIVRDLHRRGYSGQIVFVQIHRGPQDRIFGTELDALATSWANFRLVCWDTARQGRPTAADLAAIIESPSAWHTMLCGPWTLMQALRTAWADMPGARLQTESFGVPPVALDTPSSPAQVSCLVSGRQFTAAGDRALLLSAEEAGIDAPYGCRRGVCHECAVRLEAGQVRNLLTGLSVHEPGSRVQLCICVPESVQLSLNDL